MSNGDNPGVFASLRRAFALLSVLLVGGLPTSVHADEGNDGEKHYERVCSDCHAKGAKNKLAKGAPRLGDRRAWESRVSKGADVLYAKMMKAKVHGKEDDVVWQTTNPYIWREDLNDAQIRQALEYMLQQGE
jgi:cytochrome c5